jgi:cysteine desulfurase
MAAVLGIAMTRAYLDHASTSPLRPEARDAMLEWMDAADPGRVHTEGRMARAAVEHAREQVAALVGARPREVVFTSGGTEAANAAVFGALSSGRGEHVVCPAVEHSCVRDPSARTRVTFTAVDRLGRVDIDALTAAIDPGHTALVHCQWGNHEVGTVQPVTAVVAAAHEHKALVHVDAAQAVGHVAVDFASVGADLMTVSAHKFGGPKGAGALVVRRGLRLPPFVLGGEQERARRAGMENVAAIVGFGAAAAAVRSDAGAIEQARTERLAEATLAVDGVVPYGDRATEGRLPHIVCFGVEGVEAEAVLLALDQAGVAAHSGSACSSESLEPSPVLEAMGVDAERSLRLSVGWSTTEADIELFTAVFPGVVARLRALRG